MGSLNHVIIFGSRTFAPLEQVRDDIYALPAGVTIIGAGKADVITAAREAATQFEAIPLSVDRSELLTAARHPGTAVWTYAARDPETKETTEGTAQLIAWLTEEGVPVDIRRSTLTATQALAYHHLESELEKLIAAPANRRRYREGRCLAAGAALHSVHTALYRWLETHDSDPDLLRQARQSYLADHTDFQLTAALNDGSEQWIRNLRRYELVSRLLIRAKTQITLPPLTGSPEAIAA
jgi:hypothetical protein